MKFKTLVSLFGVSAVLFGSSNGVLAVGDKVDSPVIIQAKFNSGGTDRTLKMGLRKGGVLVGTEWSTEGDGSSVQTTPQPRLMELAEDHELKVEDATTGNYGITSYTLKISVPRGYEVWIGAPGADPILAELYPAPGNSLWTSSTVSNPDNLTIRVTKQQWDTNDAPIGASHSLAERYINWSVSMGRLSNGKSAGWLSVGAADFGSLTYESDDLSYSVSSDEVTVIKDGTGKILQVKAPGIQKSVIP